MARKIAVMGSSCSGKTTVAGLLAARLGVPQIELDALHHGPNWQEASAEELRARLDRMLSGTDGWSPTGITWANSVRA